MSVLGLCSKSGLRVLGLRGFGLTGLGFGATGSVVPQNQVVPGRRGRIGAGVAVSLALAVGSGYAPLPRDAPTPERFHVRSVDTTSAFL